MTNRSEAKAIARTILSADLRNLDEAKLGWERLHNRLRNLCGEIASERHAKDPAAGEAFAAKCRTEAALTAAEEFAFFGHEQSRGYFALARARLAALSGR